ncbi:hypothetical protein [Pimelobacter simplex]|uniref:hypothetical protein n=1 Tax=Nocardioides simplex TaxID=2045 RepID=UPI00214FEB04|nr:hypothetical protein [Pimelobacter simplex]UUW92046.1 hypothetical protein M0M43_11375 [Pimelobacter simplex]UUW95873.1 hypothetical protein M0M48_29875 [Pimelobacter simplex]
MKIRSTKRKRTSLAVGALAALAAVAGTFAAPSVAHADPDNPDHLTVIYDAVGSTHVAGGVNADMQVGPTEIKVTIDTVAPLPTPIVAGSMNVPSKTMNFEILGLPARAKVTMTQVGQVTGTLTPTSLRGKLKLQSNVKYDIRLSDVETKVFGIWWPLAVGNNCHTINPADITVNSPEGEYFTINGGGRATGTYTIGNFTGCAPLNFFSIPGFFPTIGSIPINVIVPNANNTIEINLSNPRYGG